MKWKMTFFQSGWIYPLKRMRQGGMGSGLYKALEMEDLMPIDFTVTNSGKILLQETIIQILLQSDLILWIILIPVEKAIQ